MKVYLVRILRWEYIPFLLVFKSKVYYTGYVTVTSYPQELLGMIRVHVWEKYKTANFEIENIFVL